MTAAKGAQSPGQKPKFVKEEAKSNAGKSTPNLMVKPKQKKGSFKPKQGGAKENKHIKKAALKRSASEAGFPPKNGNIGEQKKKKSVRVQMPQIFKSLYWWKTHRGVNEVDKTVRFTNLPDMEDNKLARELLALLKKQGEIVQYGFDESKRKQFRVVFRKFEDALDAKKLNGTVLGGHHLCVQHIEDPSVLTDNKVVVVNVLEDVKDDDIWKTFGGCGKIHSLSFRRLDKTCILTFWSHDAKEQALSSKKKCKNHEVSVVEFTPVKYWRTVYIKNLSSDVTAEEVKTFVEKIAPTEEIKLDSIQKCAEVLFKTEQGAIKAFSLNGKQLIDQKVEMLVHPHTYILFVQRRDGSEDGDDDDVEVKEEEKDSDEEEEGDDEEMDEDSNEEDEADDDDEEDDDDDDEEDDDDDNEEDDE